MFTYAKKLFCVFILVGLVACQGKDEISISTPSGQSIGFSIEVADTPEKQQKGLMFVDSLNESEGMLFLYPQESIAKFWMKNTLIPLDILFFDAQNTLIHIESNAKPHDETPRGPNTPICSVLEVNGGIAKQKNIVIGSKLITNLEQECLQ